MDLYHTLPRTRQLRSILDACTALTNGDADDVLPLGKYFVRIFDEAMKPEHEQGFLACLYKFPAKAVLRSMPSSKSLAKSIGSEEYGARFIALGAFYGHWKPWVYFDKETPMADPGWMPPTDCQHSAILGNELYGRLIRSPSSQGIVTHCPDCRLGVRWEFDEAHRMILRDDQKHLWWVADDGDGFHLVSRPDA